MSEKVNGSDSQGDQKIINRAFKCFPYKVSNSFFAFFNSVLAQINSSIYSFISKFPGPLDTFLFLLFIKSIPKFAVIIMGACSNIFSSILNRYRMHFLF